MIFQEPEREEALSASWLVNGVVGLAVVALLLIFILPNFVARLGDISTLGGAVAGASLP
jgi:hypothetical protein